MAARSPAHKSRQEGAEETRRKILRVALELFSDAPYDVVKVSSVAERAGVAHGLVFHHFGSKRGCYLGAMREAARMLGEAIQPPARGSFRRKFHPSMIRLLEFMASHESLALRLVLAGGGGDPDVASLFDEARRSRLEWIASQLGLELGSVAVAQALYAWVGTVDHGIVHWLRTGRSTRESELARFFFGTLAATIEAIPLLSRNVDIETARHRLTER